MGLSRQDLQDAISELPLGLLERNILLNFVNALSADQLAVLSGYYQAGLAAYEDGGAGGIRAYIRELAAEHNIPDWLVELIFDQMPAELADEGADGAGNN